MRVRLYVRREIRSGHLAISRRNIMTRDMWTCQCAPEMVLPTVLLNTQDCQCSNSSADTMQKLGHCMELGIQSADVGVRIFRYCGGKNDLTLDHVVPMSAGGKWSWENLVGSILRDHPGCLQQSSGVHRSCPLLFLCLSGNHAYLIQLQPIDHVHDVGCRWQDTPVSLRPRNQTSNLAPGNFKSKCLCSSP